MPKYKDRPIEDLKDALSIDQSALDFRTKPARKLKQVKRALNEDFDAALGEILEYQISLNMVMEKSMIDKALQDGNLSLTPELKALRKDSFDKLKLLEKIKKGRKFSKDEDDLAKMILGDSDE